MAILGFLGALVIGIVLGLIGGGGSILTVPIFTYILEIPAETATAYSLFVVGTTALVGALISAKHKLIDFKTGLIFAFPAFIGVYLSRRYILPNIPDELFSHHNITLNKDMAIMIFFAIIMLLAAFFMIRGKASNDNDNEVEVKYNIPMLIIEGLIVGVLTGIVGAGGGFLIIPALVLFARLPMKKAVATSLMIIAIKSFGSIGDIEKPNFWIEIDWSLLLPFTVFSILGIFIGLYMNKFIDGKKLKKGFGFFVLIVAVFIIIEEIITSGLFHI